MGVRKTILANDEFYHVYNRALDGRSIFTNVRTCRRVIKTLDFYRFISLPKKLSYILSLPSSRQDEIMKRIKQRSKHLVEILGYCLMPNHFHLLLKQVGDNGISTFLGNTENSITRYINTRLERKGSILQGQFQAKRIETPEQLIHTWRYIHINPLTSYVSKDFENLLHYPWSSLNEYLNKESGLCTKDYIYNHFRTNRAIVKFLKNNVNYQRKLRLIKHLLIEEVGQ